MKINFNRLGKEVLDILRRLGYLADRKGVTVYLVGGFVRDLILKQGNLDIDLVVEGDATAFAEAFAKEQKADIKIYKEFGTATLIYPNGFRLDFATARQEIYQRPGALPTVSSGSIRDDLYRRDFTINAMAVVLNRPRFGELVDIFGGLKDLKSGQIRILHPKSFLDDPTRILRAVRFEQRFDFRLETKTLGLLKSAIQNGYIQYVTPSRYFVEFKKILIEAHPTKAIQRLHQLRGLGFLRNSFRPNLAVLSLLEKNIVEIQKKDPYKNYNAWWLIYLMGLLESWDAVEIRNLIDSLNLTRIEKEGLLNCPQSRRVINKLKTKGLKPRQVYALLKPLELPIIYFIRVRTSVNIIGRYVDNFLKIYFKVKLSVTGEDLKRLGILPGEKMGKILHELLLRKVEGKLKSHQKELKEIARVQTMIQEK